MLDHSLAPDLAVQPATAPTATPIKQRASTALAKGLACEGCKTRKVKCPAEKPACKNCVRQGRQCHYPEPRHGTTGRQTITAQPSVHRYKSHDSPKLAFAPYTSSMRSSQQPAPLPRVQQVTSSSNMLSIYPLSAETSQKLPSGLEELDLSWCLSGPLMNSAHTASLPDLTAAEQEQCLWLYFSRMDSVVVEMNIARFYERLAAPDPVDRPHLALLNAMFLTVSKVSPLEHVRAQEEELFNKSEKLFKSALRDMAVVTNNTVDLVQCAVLMSVWLWGRCREAEAFFMTSTACRLSLFGGFEQISDSNNVKGPGESLLVQARGSICPPMRDAVELADRIYTFWAVIMLDLTGSIATGIPPNIDITAIRTPLPRPWVEYGMEPQTEDSYLIDLFTPKFCTGPPSQNEWPHFIRATVLLHLAIAKVTDSRQGTPWRDLEQMSPNTPSSVVLGSSESSSARDGFRRRPCLDLEGAVERFAAELPPEFKSLGSINSSQRNSQVIMMQTTLACIRMYLADTNDYTSPNDAALYQARKIVDMAKFVESGAPLVPNLCLYVMWVKTVKLLTREVKRLQHIGEALAAISLESDANTLFKSLESAAEHSPLVASTLSTTLQSVRAATLPVQQETPISVADSLGRTASSEYKSPPQGKNGTPCL